MNWNQATIDDLVEFHDDRRVPLSAIERDSFQGIYPYYGAQGIIDYVREYRYDGQFVLVAEDGANLVTRKEPVAHIATGRFWVNNHAHAIQASKGKSTNWYICALLNWLNLSPYVTGAAQPKLSQKNLRAIKVRVPDFDSQLRITNLLSKYDLLIENNRRRISILEESAQRLYEEWFVRLRFPGHKSKLLAGNIPDGWLRKVVPQLIDVNPKTLAKRDDEKTYVPMAGLTENFSIITQTETRTKSSGAKFVNGDTLLARITPCIENGKTALVQLLEDEEVAIGSTEFIVLRPKRVGSAWTYCFARSRHLRQTAINSMKGSDGRQRVNPACFNDYPVLLPHQNCLTDSKE